MHLELSPKTVLENSSIFDSVRDGIHEAGNPYYDYIFGDADRTRKVLARWMTRKSSEVSTQRVTLAFQDGSDIGGYIALPGKDLGACRQADGLAAVLSVTSTEREALQQRMRNAGSLFEIAEPDELYLSKVWVHSNFRGAGYGAAILRSFLSQGEQSGYCKFRLDVSSERGRAVAMYKSAGFKICSEKSCPAGLRYLGMIRVV